MHMKSICVLRGDGIGPEVIDCAVRVLQAATDELEFVHAEIGRSAYRRTGRFLPPDTLQMMVDSDSCLFGAVTSQTDPCYESPVLEFRSELDLHANVRPIRDVARCHPRAEETDLVIIRENTEGLYTGDEAEDETGVTTLRRVTRRASERIVDFAVDFALRRERTEICCVHKANVLRQSDGLFLSVFEKAMQRYAGRLSSRNQLVDSAAARLVMAPDGFDVIVTLNLYGDILSDVAAAAVGGLGFAPSGNIGPVHSVFEPAHGSAPDIAGKGVANPTAAILSSCLMLDHLGLSAPAESIASAISDAYQNGERTTDVGGVLGSDAFTDRVIERTSGSR